MDRNAGDDALVTSYAKAPTTTVTAPGNTFAYRELGPRGGVPRTRGALGPARGVPR